MGLIQNIKNWRDKKKDKNQKLIEEAKKNPLETIKKLLEENPDKIEEIIQALIADSKISDKIIVDLLNQAPEDILLHTLRGLAKLDDEVNINKDVAEEVIKGIVKAAKKIDNVNYPRVKQAIKNATPEEKEEEAIKGVNKINSIMYDEVKRELDKIYNDNDLYKPISDSDIYLKIKEVMDNKGLKEIPEEIKEKINNIFAKIKANEFNRTGTVIIKSDLKYIVTKPEEFLKNNIPQLIEEEYEKLPNKSNYGSKEFLENVHKTPKLKIAIINQIMNKIAFEIAHNDEKQIEEVMEYVKENNPDLNEKEISQIEQHLLKEIETLLISKDKEFDEQEIRKKINRIDPRDEKLKEIYNSLKDLSEEELEEIQELIKVSKEFKKEEIGQVTNILRKYTNKEKDEETENKEVKEKELDDDGQR